MKSITPIKIKDVVRLKIPIYGINSHLYVIKYIDDKSILCEYFYGAEQQNITSPFLLSDVDKIIYGDSH